MTQPASISLVPRTADSPASGPASLARAMAGLAIAVGVLVLIGWWTDIPWLTSILPGWVTMKPNTALALAAAGWGLWLLATASDDGHASVRHRIGAACTLLCAAVGAITLLEYVTGLRFADQLIARVPADATITDTPGRMAATTAASLVAIGAGIALLGARARRFTRISQSCLAAGAALPLSVVVGYLYRVIPIHGLGQGLQMALHTAVACLALAIGGFAARPDREFVRVFCSRSTGGLLARRLLPAALGVPILLGALELAGERGGLLTMASGGAAVTAGTMFLLAWLVWRTATEIERSDEARSRSEHARTTAVAAQAAAEAGNAEKSRFLTTMSHELRTPLNAIIGFTDLLDAGIYGPATNAQREALARVRRSSHHLLGLVDQVLTVARVQSGAPAPGEVEEFLLDEVIASVADLVVPQCRTRDVRCVVERAGASRRVWADVQHVTQVLLNLLGNAVKFTAPGGLVSVVADSDGREVVIRVSDTGHGVPLDKRDAIFSPFVQAESGLTRRTDGAGLGLSISRELAREMDGDVRLERSDERGSVFVFSFPIRPGPPQRMARAM